MLCEPLSAVCVVVRSSVGVWCVHFLGVVSIFRLYNSVALRHSRKFQLMRGGLEH
jgi:hypothetical protein